MRTGTGVSYMIIAAALCGAGLAAGPALAQPVNACLGLPTDAERLACMRDVRAAEAAAESQAQAELAAQQAAAEAAARAGAAPQAQAGVAAPATPGQSAADRCFALPTDAERLSCMRDALAIAEAALAAQDSGNDGGFLGLGIFGGGGERADALVASESEFARGLGAEQVNARSGSGESEDIRVQAKIVELTKWGPGLNQFELDNGQVWRQLDGDTQQVRLGGSDPRDVELFGSWAGGYRMRIPSQRLTLQVRRIR